MPRKKRVVVQREEDLEAIDAELDAATRVLVEANAKVGELLESFAPAEPEDPATAEEPGTGREDSSEPAGGPFPSPSS